MAEKQTTESRTVAVPMEQAIGWGAEMLSLLLEYSQNPHLPDDRAVMEALAMHLIACREQLRDTMHEIQPLLAVAEAARAWRAATTTYRATMDAMTEGATVLDQRLRDALFSMRRAEDDLFAALAALEEDGDGE